MATFSDITTGAVAGSNLVSGLASVANLLLVSPQATVGYQPQSKASTGAPLTQLPALLFHYEGENTATLESDITDHYVEDNTAIQDQIAIRPLIITTQGFIGELNDVPPNRFFAAAQQAAQKLTTITAYTPSLSATALLAYNESVFAYTTALNVVNSAISSYSSIAGIVAGANGTSVIVGQNLQVQPAQTKQQTYYQQFYAYQVVRTLFTIQTPWAIFENMAIKTLRAVQGADTRMITDFEVTFKQMNFASTSTTNSLYGDASQFQSRLANQGASLTALGTSALTTSSTTFASVLS